MPFPSNCPQARSPHARRLKTTTLVEISNHESPISPHNFPFHINNLPNSGPTSTGPRTESGKKRSSQNALRHGLTARTATPQSPAPSPQFAALGLHSSRLSRQFQKTLDQLRDIQHERRQHERCSERMMRQNEARPIAWARFELDPNQSR